MLRTLVVAVLVFSTTGCASMRRHPAIYGAVIGGGIMVTYSLAHRQGCPSVIDGYPYNGYGRPCPTRCDEDGCYWPHR